jgi:hypothetical protein
MVDGQDRSTTPSTGSTLSNQSSKEDDLDLDSLFKRLDKYTAEMEEVEERLRRARSNSEKSDGINIKRFSFEESYSPDMNRASKQSEPSRSSSRGSRHRHASFDGVKEDEGQAQVESPSSSSLSNRSRSRCASLDVPQKSEKAPVVDDATKEALAASHDHAQRQEEQEEQDDNPRPAVFGDWKAWAEQQFPSTQPKQERSSSRYSDRMESIQTSPTQRFLWKRLSPSPPLKETRRSPTLRKAHTPSPAMEEQVESESDCDVYLPEDDEPGPSIPTPWSLPPRSSSKRVVSDESLPPRSSSGRVISDEVVQEQENTPARPALRRRMTTSDGRPSIRNGGFWSDHTVGLFNQDDVPPVPALSQSNSNATLKSSPPLTPLTIGDPREDQLRRELETLSIQDGAEALEHRYKKRRPPMLNLLDSDDEREESTPIATPSEPDHSNSLHDEDDEDTRSLRPRPRRRKSIFSLFQRKSPVEKLIDMYFDDEPEKKPIPKRRSTRSRRGSPIQETLPMSPAIPPQFQALHEKQTSL